MCHGLHWDKCEVFKCIFFSFQCFKFIFFGNRYSYWKGIQKKLAIFVNFAISHFVPGQVPVMGNSAQTVIWVLLFYFLVFADRMLSAVFLVCGPSFEGPLWLISKEATCQASVSENACKWPLKSFLDNFSIYMKFIFVCSYFAIIFMGSFLWRWAFPGEKLSHMFSRLN